MKFKNHLLISTLMGAFISGCGGGGGGSADNSPPPEPKDPLTAYKNQKINWGSCDAYFSKYSDSDGKKYITKLGDRLQCADIDAPLNYSKPDDLRVKISMMQVRAAESSDKKPHLFFNPGGPGGDGFTDSLEFSLALSIGNPQKPIGSMYREISENFNFIGFSPRGVGASTNISCAGNQLVYPTDDTAAGGNSENIKRITEIAKYTAINCQKNPVSDYINTDATARDMDLMRHLLGDKKMHYYGTSYGTWLGFWYAGIFPDQVGPMVLDSNMNFSQSIHQAGISYEQGRNHTFNDFIAPYAARHNDVFELGSSKQEIIENLENFHPITKQILVQNQFRAEPGAIAESLAITKLLKVSSDGLKNNLDLDSISKNMQNMVIETGDEEVDNQKSSLIKNIVSEINSLQNPDYWYTPRPFPVSDYVFDTVVCNDEAISNKDPVFWINTGFELARALPIGRNNVASQPCLYWKRNAAFTKPAMNDLKAAKLMMVQSQYDVPTPLSGAMETFNQLPATSMVYVKNEGSHGLQFYGTECVDLTVMRYLLGQAPVNRMTTCEGKPMTLDKPATGAAKTTAGQSKASPRTDDSDEEASNFEDPELARRLIERLRGANSAASH